MKLRNKAAAKRAYTLQDIDVKPPRSLPELRKVLHGECVAIVQELAKVEKDYFQHQSPLEYVRQEGVQLREVLDAFKLSEITSLHQIQAVIRLARTPELQTSEKRISEELVGVLVKVQNRILEFMPARFEGMTTRLKRLLEVCERYLLPFYSLEDETYVDTARSYVNNIHLWKDEVQSKVKQVYHLPQAFLKSGVNLALLSTPAVDVLERGGFLSLPILAMFMDSAHQIRSANEVMHKWIAYDQQYTEFLHNDAVSLKKQLHDTNKALQRAQEQSHQLQYQLKHITAESATLQVDIDQWAAVEVDLLLEEESLFHEISNCHVDIELKEFHKEELTSQLMQGLPTAPATEEYQQQLAEVTEELRTLKHRLPQLRRRRQGYQLKLAWLHEKQKKLEDIKTKMPQIEQQLLASRMRILSLEMEQDQLQRSVDKCGEVHRYKASCDVLQRIFYQMPIQAPKTVRTLGEMLAANATHRGSPGRNPATTAAESGKSLQQGGGSGSGRLSPVLTSRDELEEAILIVSKDLGRDWMALYRALPFVPQRGTRVIDEDVQEMEHSVLGDSTHERALRMFQRWRRFHLRARMEDLKTALEHIQRKDLLLALRKHFEPESLQFEEQESIPAFLRKDLIPCYREILKYDKMQALANKG